MPCTDQATGKALLERCTQQGCMGLQSSWLAAPSSKHIPMHGMILARCLGLDCKGQERLPGSAPGRSMCPGVQHASSDAQVSELLHVLADVFKQGKVMHLFHVSSGREISYSGCRWTASGGPQPDTTSFCHTLAYDLLAVWEIIQSLMVPGCTQAVLPTAAVGCASDDGTPQQLLPGQPIANRVDRARAMMNARWFACPKS